MTTPNPTTYRASRPQLPGIDHIFFGANPRDIAGRAEPANPNTLGPEGLDQQPPTRQSQREWGQPEPLTDNASVRWPHHELSGSLVGRMGAYIAETIGTSYAMGDQLALGAVACAAGGKYEISIDGNWTETSNIYLFGSARPGSRKSASFNAAFRPLQDWGREQLTDQQPRLRTNVQLDILRKQRQRYVNDAASDPDANLDRLYEVEQAIYELQDDHPSKPYYDDLTPESVGAALGRGGGRMNIASDEAGNLQGLATGRYASGQPNLDLLLKGYDGSRCGIERMGRPAVDVDHPRINIVVFGQPDLQAELVRDRLSAQRGTWARFLVSNVDQERRSESGSHADEIVARQWNSAVRRLLELPTPTGRTGLVLRLTSQAAGTAKSLSEAYLSQAANEHADIDGWITKHAGRSVRLAGLMHVLEHHQAAGAGALPPLPDATLQTAVGLAAYYIHQAKHLLGQATLSGEQILLDWMRGREQFNTAEARQALRRHVSLATADGIARAVAGLQAKGYIRLLDVPGRRGRGRPSAPTYEVNPLIS